MFYKAKNNKIDIEDTTVNYISFGKGTKNLIMIPGLGDGLKTVKGIAIPFSIMYKKFAKDYKVYVFSRRNKLNEKFTTADMARDIVTLMDKLGIEKTDVLGVSLGGMIAQYIAINYPERVNKLVLTVTSSRPNEILNSVIGGWIEFAKKDDFKSIFIDTSEKSYTESLLKKGRKYYGIICKFGKPKSFDRFLIQADACLEHNTYDKLSKIKCPTFVIGGGQDKILGVKASIDIADKIKSSELYVYEDYGHGVYEEAKDYNDKVLEFLNK